VRDFLAGSVGVRGSNPLSSTDDQVSSIRRFCRSESLLTVLRRSSVIDLFDGRVTLAERMGSGLLPTNGLLGMPVRAMARPYVILSQFWRRGGQFLPVLADRD
jgi:hypothetical protein